MSVLPKSPKDRTYIRLALKITGDFGATIAVPLIIFVLIGQWLDSKCDKEPLFTILGFVLAAILSAKIIHKKAKQYGKEYESIDKNENKQ